MVTVNKMAPPDPSGQLLWIRQTTWRASSLVVFLRVESSPLQSPPSSLSLSPQRWLSALARLPQGWLTLPLLSRSSELAVPPPPGPGSAVLAQSLLRFGFRSSAVQLPPLVPGFHPHPTAVLPLLLPPEHRHACVDASAAGMGL